MSHRRLEEKARKKRRKKIPTKKKAGEEEGEEGEGWIPHSCSVLLINLLLLLNKRFKGLQQLRLVFRDSTRCSMRYLLYRLIHPTLQQPQISLRILLCSQAL